MPIKEKLYCPDTVGGFKMMFGFKQPTNYYKNKWKSIAKVRVTEASLRQKNKYDEALT